MASNREAIRHTLESHLKSATHPQSGLRESIHINQVADPVDMTQQAAEREITVQSINRDSALVRRVRSAIERLNDGSYGICLDCEEEIAPKRLKAIPWAELCLHCQETADRSTTKNEPIRFTSYHAKAA